MQNKIDRLKNLNDTKLIDVVKNYRQYGYEEEIRHFAIKLLEERGHDMESLKLRGDLINKSYDNAELYFNAFEKHSKLAFIFYALVLIIEILIPVIAKSIGSVQIMIVIVSWICLIGYVVSLIQSFVSQSKYHKLIGKKDSQLNPVMFFTLGMILYMIMYFVFRKQMKDDMNLIR